MKDNKLLAEYLGYSLIRIGYWGLDNGTTNAESRDQRDLGHKYLDSIGIEKIGMYYLKVKEKEWIQECLWIPNENWNQLMMVVEKIEEENPNTFRMEVCELSGEYQCDLWTTFGIKAGAETTMIEAVHSACVTYIKSKK